VRRRRKDKTDVQKSHPYSRKNRSKEVYTTSLDEAWFEKVVKKEKVTEKIGEKIRNRSWIIERTTNSRRGE